MANGSYSLIKERRVGTNKDRLVSSTAVSNKSANRNKPGKLDDTIQFPSLRVRKRLYVKGNNFQLLPVKDHETGLQLLHYLFLVNGSNQLGAARFESSSHGVRLVWRKVQNLAYARGCGHNLCAGNLALNFASSILASRFIRGQLS